MNKNVQTLRRMEDRLMGMQIIKTWDLGHPILQGVISMTMDICISILIPLGIIMEMPAAFVGKVRINFEENYLIFVIKH